MCERRQNQCQLEYGITIVSINQYLTIIHRFISWMGFQLKDEVFDGREPTMIVVDDHMSDVNQLVADIFTTISHHHSISILYLTQNLFDKNKYVRTISLNAHYLTLFKNRRDAGQFVIFARQMYPTCWKFTRTLRACHMAIC